MNLTVNIVDKINNKVDRWLIEEPTKLKTLYHWLLFARHNRLPKDFRLFGVTHWFVRFSLIASAPALAYYVYDRITLSQAVYAVLILFLLFSISSILDLWSKSKNKTLEQAYSETWVRIGDLITTVKSSATLQKNRDDTITAALGVIEGYARVITKSPKGEISVSLALYDGKSTSKMKIHHRNPGNDRPIGRYLKNLENVLGHRACIAGPAPRVVSDLKWFGKEIFSSPTHAVCKYRSILLVPITASKTGKIKGFLSVDCIRPHAFHGKCADQIVVTCEPLIDHIQDLF